PDRHDYSATLYSLCLAQLSGAGRSRGPSESSLADGARTVAYAPDLGTPLCDSTGAAARADWMSGAPAGHAVAALGSAGPRGRHRQYAPARQRRCLAQETSAGWGSPAYLD